MNFPLLSLEIRKNRLAAASVVAAFLVTLPVARLVASTTGMEAGNALSTILIGWAFVGLPFAAALIGATAGSGTASSGNAGIEALLPASATRRAAASLTAAGFLLAITAAFVLACAWFGNALAPYLIAPDKAFSWGRPFWQNMPVTNFFLLMIADVLAASWVLAYLIGHGVAGGLLGPALVIIESFGVGLCLGMRMEHGEWVSSLAGYETAMLAFLVLVKLVAVPAAARLERRPSPRVRAWAFPAAALLAGPLATWLMAGAIASGLDARLRFAEPAPVFSYQSWFEDSSPTPAALAAAGRSAALMSVRGGIWLGGKEGVRVVLPEERSGVYDLVFRPFEGAWLFRTLRDSTGRLWAHRVTPLRDELWSQTGEAMTLGRPSPRNEWGNLAVVGRRVVVTKYLVDPKTGISQSSYAAAEDFIHRGSAAPFDKSLNDAIKTAVKAAGAGVVDCDKRCLRVGARRWRLPGPALYAGPVFPHWAGGKPAYFIPYKDASGTAAALCRADGTVTTAWRLGVRRERGDFYALPDGTLYAYQPGDALGIIGTDGKVSTLRYGRLRPKGASLDPLPWLLHRAGGRVWLLWDRALVEAGDDGVLKSTRALPRWESFRTLEDGFLYDDGRSVRYLGWDATSRRLSKP